MVTVCGSGLASVGAGAPSVGARQGRVDAGPALRQRQAGCAPVVTLCLPAPVTVMSHTWAAPDFGVYV